MVKFIATMFFLTEVLQILGGRAFVMFPVVWLIRNRIDARGIKDIHDSHGVSFKLHSPP